MLELEVQIKQGLDVGFIMHIQHPTLLAKIVPVKKNNEICCCIDFQDFNKSCPKDAFALPNLNMLVDATTGHSIFSFIDDFSGYSQIKMHPLGAENTAFRTQMGKFHYTDMLLGHKT